MTVSFDPKKLTISPVGSSSTGFDPTKRELDETPDTEPEHKSEASGSTTPPRRPAPPKHGNKWWACVNDECSKQGYVCTSDGVETLRQRRRCKNCHGLALEPGTEDPCEECNGVGAFYQDITRPKAPDCPACGHRMGFVSEGARPEGYPRMELGSPDDSDIPGNVRWGRVRKVE